MEVDQGQLAESLGVHRKTIFQWQKEGLPVERMEGPHNVYDLAKCIEWYVKRRVGNDLTFEKTRLTKAQADKTEIEKQLLEKKLLRSENVEREWSNVIIAVRAKLLSIPTKFAPEALQAENLQDFKLIIERAIKEALDELKEIKLSDYAD